MLLRFAAALALAAGLASTALAQDELPKDAPPPPKAQSTVTPTETPDAGSALPPGSMVDQPVALLQALDKITARVSRITVPVGGTVTFGSLQITAKACDKHPPEETPESSAFLQIVEVKQGEAPVGRFSGWMFASSPALSALEHPVYDIWVLDCINAESAPGGSSP